MTLSLLLRHFLLVTAMLCLAPTPAQTQADKPHHHIAVTAKRMRADGQSFMKVSASGFAAATPQQVWQVLTDYERFPEFLPKLSSSKLISRTANEVLVEQNGKAGFLFIKHNIHLLVRINEQPFSAIDLTLVRGDMKHYVARWELSPLTSSGRSGTLITYAATLEPDFFVPPLIGRQLVEADVQETMEAVITEIDRRIGSVASQARPADQSGP
jgi:ribosome-associated toxin RatA of RatAB toxin-antitoxin module